MRWPAGTSRSPIGIDVGARQIKAVQLSGTGPARRVEAAAVVPRTGADLKQEARHVRDALAGGRFKGTDIVLAMPSDKLLAGIFELPPRDSGAPLEQIARAELSRLHKCDGRSFEMAYWDLPAPVRVGAGTHVMAAACLHADADAFLDAFESQGLQARGLEIHASAAARACRPVLPDRGGIAAILDLGWSLARLVLLHQDVVVYERKLAKGGIESLVAAEADKHERNADAVEHLLIAHGLDAAPRADDADAEALEDLRDAAQQHVAGIIEEMRIPLSYLGNQYPDAPVERLLLIGGGASIPALQASLASRLEFEVRVVRLADLAACPPALDADHGPALTVAIGLAEFAGGADS